MPVALPPVTAVCTLAATGGSPPSWVLPVALTGIALGLGLIRIARRAHGRVASGPSTTGARGSVVITLAVITALLAGASVANTPSAEAAEGCAAGAPAAGANAAGAADPASAVDLTPDLLLTPSTGLTVGTSSRLSLRLSLVDVSGAASTAPITVRIPKKPGMSNVALSGAGWTIDSTSDPASHVLVFTGTIPTGAPSPAAVLDFDFVPGAAGPTTFSATIDTGSGGDTVASNNTALEEADVAPAPPARVDLTPILRLLPSTGIPVRTNRALTLRLQVVNLTTPASGSPIVVRVAKVPGMSGVTLSGTGWTLDAAADPDDYVLTYDRSIPGGDAAVAALGFQFERDTVGATTFTATIDPGSGGDDNPANNSDTETVDVVIVP